MRHPISLAILLLVSSACAGCISVERAAYLSQPQKIEELQQLGWQFESPVPAAQTEPGPAYATHRPWVRFKSRIKPGDELRAFTNKSAQGYAVFRDGVLVDLYPTVIF